MFPKVLKKELKALLLVLDNFINWQAPAIRDAYSRAKVLVKSHPRSDKYRAGAQFIGAMRHLNKLGVSNLVLENKNLLWYQGSTPGFYALTEAYYFFDSLATTVALNSANTRFTTHQGTATISAGPLTAAAVIVNGQQESITACASAGTAQVDGLITASQSSMDLQVARFKTFRPPFRSCVFTPMVSIWERRAHSKKELSPLARDLLPGSESLEHVIFTDGYKNEPLLVARQWGKYYPGVIGRPSPALLSAIDITTPSKICN